MSRCIVRAFRVWVLFLLLHSGVGPVPVAWGVEFFRVASYNVENLFDLNYDGTEYPGYVPDGKYGWNSAMMAIKANNISRVLVDLDADIIALQEIESIAALDYLRSVLRGKGLDYPYGVVTREEGPAVRCALLSRFPVIESKDIVVPGRHNRNILQATLKIGDARLVVFVNHWRSRNAPESHRKRSARKLMEAVEKLPPQTDYILIGDFNTNYNEFEILPADERLNDTSGKTGINHLLSSISGNEPVTHHHLLEASGKGLHYNLWHEVEKNRRWSYVFFGQRRTLDNILIPGSLFDDSGISYLRHSFDTFDAGYLFKDGKIYRWQREDRGRGRHLGKGYSDHLPIYACFTTRAFEDSDVRTPCYPEPILKTISDLYSVKTGDVRYRIEGATVVYKWGSHAVVKQGRGRAIYLYGVAGDLELGGTYTLLVNRLQRYYGNTQVAGLEGKTVITDSNDINGLFLTDPEAELAESRYENEVISERAGHYENGRFHYAPERSIRLFFRNEAHAPDRNGPVIIRNARIGFHREPEVVIETPMQIQAVNEKTSEQ